MPLKNLYSIFAVTAVLLPACAWLDSGPSMYDSFDAESLAEGGLGIGGVVVASGPREGDDHEARLADLMRSEIIDARYDVKITSSGYIERTLGQETYRALVETYRRHGPLDSEILLEISDTLAERLRYLLFARVEHDSISTSIVERETQSSEHRESTDYITHRHIGATFHLYDLVVPRLLWTVYLEASADRTLTRRKRAETPGTLPVSLYPDPITLDAVAVYLFDDFAARLPGQPPPAPAQDR